MNPYLINRTNNFVRLKDIEEKFFYHDLKATDYFTVLEHFGYIEKTKYGFADTEKSRKVGCDHHVNADEDGNVYLEYVTWSVMIYDEVEKLLKRI